MKPFPTLLTTTAAVLLTSCASFSGGGPGLPATGYDYSGRDAPYNARAANGYRGDSGGYVDSGYAAELNELRATVREQGRRLALLEKGVLQATDRAKAAERRISEMSGDVRQIINEADAVMQSVSAKLDQRAAAAEDRIRASEMSLEITMAQVRGELSDLKSDLSVVGTRMGVAPRAETPTIAPTRVEPSASRTDPYYSESRQPAAVAPRPQLRVERQPALATAPAQMASYRSAPATRMPAPTFAPRQSVARPSPIQMTPATQGRLAPVEPPKMDPTASLFAVVMTFDDMTSAVRMFEFFKQNGVLDIQYSQRNGGHRLFLGRFSSRDLADRRQSFIKDRFGMSASIEDNSKFVR